MYFADEKHKDDFIDALLASGAVRDGGKIDGYFGASLYLLTGLPFAWERIKRHVSPGCLDFEKMLRTGLSSGEAIIVRLAGNFYNGGFWEKLTPWDIVSILDDNCLSLVLCAFSLRARSLSFAEVDAA